MVPGQVANPKRSRQASHEGHVQRQAASGGVTTRAGRRQSARPGACKAFCVVGLVAPTTRRRKEGSSGEVSRRELKGDEGNWASITK